MNLLRLNGGGVIRVFEFFFSSRRRNTRFDWDWSSDVCSSDLRGVPILLVRTPEVARLSLCMMVLLMIFTFNASCNDIPAPSQPATLLTMMLLVMVTSCQSAAVEIGRASCRERV